MMIKHIDYPIPPKTHSPMYLMHKFWARKPHNVIAEYIEHYSKENDIILDPFVGSGVTAIEAVKAGRKAIAIDLDPFATFVTRITGVPCNLVEYKAAFARIENQIRSRIDSLYTTVCTLCGSKTIAEATIWNNNNPKEIRYSCKCSKGKLWKEVEKKDKILIKDIVKREIPYWYPTNELIWNTRVNVHPGTHVYDLFTNRNLQALSILYNEINGIADKKIREVMRFTFSSALPQASKMVFIIRRRGRSLGKTEESTPEVGSWATRGYWVPQEYFEINVWNCFANRFRKVVRGKLESNEVLGKRWKESQSFNDLQSSKSIFIQTGSALDMKDIPANSVDYVFTDPPYGDSVPYLELHYMFSSWLGFEPNFDQEVIISDSPIRERKSRDLYSSMLKKSFQEVFRVLKPDKYLTVTFHNADIGIYNLVIRALVLAGFDLERIVYQPPARASAKTLLAPYGSAEGDYYIRFKKPLSSKQIIKEEDVDNFRFETLVLDIIKRIISNRGEPVTYNDILKSIYIELDKEGYITIATTEKIQKILDRNKNKEFVHIKGQGWWFKEPEKYFLHITPLQDRVEKIIIQALRRKTVVTFDEILREIFLTLPNGLTPEPAKVMAILEHYAKKIIDHKWVIKPNLELRVTQHSKMIGMLAEIGKEFNFIIHVGKREQGDLYNNQPLATLNNRQLPAMSKQQRMIDLLWFDVDRIVYAFEVEYTTGITEALIRGSYLPSSTVQRVCVIPEERENLLFQKVNAPFLKDKIEEHRWKFIFFNSLQNFYLLLRTRKKPTLSDFEKLLQDLRDERREQFELFINNEN